jgi:hypothetical protein
MISISQVTCDEDHLEVLLSDGMTIIKKIDEFSRLRNASKEHLANCEIIGNGVGIHWADLDEDLSLAGLITL